MERLKKIMVSSVLLILAVSATAGIFALNQLAAAALNS